MAAIHPDFRPIQERLARLGLYSATLDTEWGTGMREGIEKLLSDAEAARGLGPLPAPPPPPPPPAVSLPAGLHNIPIAYRQGLLDAGVLPRHLAFALSLVGVREGPGAADSPIIMGWRAEMLASGIPHIVEAARAYVHDSIAWCGFGMMYIMWKSGRDPVAGPLWALNWGSFGVDGGQPELGDLMTFIRPGGGHVALYIGEDRLGFYHILGCNQGDSVSIVRIAKSRMQKCRQPPYNSKPASVRPRILAANGTVSRNEA